MGRSTCGTPMVVLATILGPIVMVLLAISLATDFWLVFDVNQSQISGVEASDRKTNVVVARYTTERHRGMWRECYPSNDTECKSFIRPLLQHLPNLFNTCHAYISHRG